MTLLGSIASRVVRRRFHFDLSGGKGYQRAMADSKPDGPPGEGPRGESTTTA